MTDFYFYVSYFLITVQTNYLEEALFRFVSYFSKPIFPTNRFPDILKNIEKLYKNRKKNSIWLMHQLEKYTLPLTMKNQKHACVHFGKDMYVCILYYCFTKKGILEKSFAHIVFFKKMKPWKY